MKLAALSLLFALWAGANCLCSAPLVYSLEGIDGILQELGKHQHEQSVKVWLKQNRPEQFERLFGENQPDPPEANANDRGLLSALFELNAAIAEPRIALLDYYINQKAAEGWQVVSITDQLILFRRAASN